ncbi:hypothetical protein RFI_38270, partial [Reticulomyxa filosa]
KNEMKKKTNTNKFDILDNKQQEQLINALDILLFTRADVGKKGNDFEKEISNIEIAQNERMVGLKEIHKVLSDIVIFTRFCLLNNCANIENIKEEKILQ